MSLRTISSTMSAHALESVPLSEQPPHPDFDVTNRTNAGGGMCFEVTYVKRDAGDGVVQLWRATGEGGDRIALHERALRIQSGGVIAAKTVQVMPGDYSVTSRVFADAERRWGSCDIDAFASEATALCKRFFIPGRQDKQRGQGLGVG